jgi:retron-type reverse transcriptase
MKIQDINKENCNEFKLYQALMRAKKGKTDRHEVAKILVDPMPICAELADQLLNGTFRPSDYIIRYIAEPKNREIAALPFPDRIVHQWVVGEFLAPKFVPSFIPDTYACIAGRGSLAAVQKVTQLIRRARAKYGDNFYIVQIDISKFFPSIDRAVLWRMLSKDFAGCPKLLNLLRVIFIDVPNPRVTGLPIGNLTSQYSSNRYLSDLDHLVTDGRIRTAHPGIVGYVRYMDDFVTVCDNKQTALSVYHALADVIVNDLHLKINTKSRIYPGKLGVNFCGYINYCDTRQLSDASNNA